MLTGLIRDKRGYARPGFSGLGDNRDGEINSNTGQPFPNWIGTMPYAQPPVGTVDPLTCQPMTQADLDRIRASNTMAWVPQTYTFNKCPGIIPTSSDGWYGGWQLVSYKTGADAAATNQFYADNPTAYGSGQVARAPDVNTNPTGYWAYLAAPGKAKQIVETYSWDGTPGGVFGPIYDANNVNDRNMVRLQNGENTVQQDAINEAAVQVLRGASVQQILDTYKNSVLLQNDTAIKSSNQDLYNAANGYNGPQIVTTADSYSTESYRGYLNPATGIYDGISTTRMDRPARLFGQLTFDEINFNNNAVWDFAKSLATSGEIAQFPGNDATSLQNLMNVVMNRMGSAWATAYQNQFPTWAARYAMSYNPAVGNQVLPPSEQTGIFRYPAPAPVTSTATVAPATASSTTPLISSPSTVLTATSVTSTPKTATDVATFDPTAAAIAAAGTPAARLASDTSVTSSMPTSQVSTVDASASDTLSSLMRSLINTFSQSQAPTPVNVTVNTPQSSQAGAVPVSAQVSQASSIGTWVSQNPLLTAGIAVGALLFLGRK